MKKFTLGAIIGAMFLIASLLPSFKFVSQKDSATVEQKEGIYIFMYSKPISGYDYLGSVKKTGIVMSGSPEEMFNTLLRRCKKEYPQADGMIITSPAMEKADCIKLKD